MLKAIIFVIIAFGLTACTHLQTLEQFPELDPKVLYKPDILIDCEGYRGQGYVVLPDKPSYKCTFTAPGKIDLIKISTCHRVISSEDVKKNWLSSGKKYKWTYIPDPTIEKNESCQVTIEAYEAGIPGRHSFGVMEINAPRRISYGESVFDVSLLAEVKCDGVKRSYAGVSMCVSQDSLVQRIRFNKPVRQFVKQEKCRIPVPRDRTKWVYSMPNRECAMVFCEDNSYKCHRHTTLGWEELAVRK